MVLQQAPARSAVWGSIDFDNAQHDQYRGHNVTKVVLTVTGSNGDSYDITAPVIRDEWIAYLRPTPSSIDVRWSIATAPNHKHARHSDATLTSVLFGDVWICTGQSNMVAPLKDTYGANVSIARAALHKYDNVRIMLGDPNSAFGRTNPRPWRVAADAAAAASSSSSSSSSSSISSSSRGGGHSGGSGGSGSGSMTESLTHACGVAWYFAEALTERVFAAGGVPPIIGLVCVGRGGTYIEQWAPRGALDDCRHRFHQDDPEMASMPGEWFTQLLAPLTRLSIKGWLWYHGEYNVGLGHVSGSSLSGVGYGCMLPALLRSWRALWSREANTTAADAPFGVVTLAAGAHWHGGRDIGSLRHAQTANYGALPNEAMPNTFLAQAYDLHDPWSEGGVCVFDWRCCEHFSPDPRLCANKTASVGGPVMCRPACAAWKGTPVSPSLRWIHIPLKRPIGERLATAAHRLVYPDARAQPSAAPAAKPTKPTKDAAAAAPAAPAAAAFTGPTLSSCSLSRGLLLINFSRELLGGESVVVPADGGRFYGGARSRLEVLTSRDRFCMQLMQRCEAGKALQMRNHKNASYFFCPWKSREFFCPRPYGFQHDPTALRGQTLDEVTDFATNMHAHLPPTELWEDAWRPVSYHRMASDQIGAELDALRGAAIHAVRYAWGISDSHNKEGSPCSREAEPHVYLSKPCHAPGIGTITASGGLPANPFLARIVDGRCQCIPPQQC